jgi:hypothetical protein
MLNCLCRTGCQRDEFVCGVDDDVLLIGVSLRVGMVRISQVMHRVDQRLPEALELRCHLGQHVGPDGVETEMHVENVELPMVGGYPAGFQHQRWPPPAGYRATIGRLWIIKPDNIIRAID